MSDQDTTVIMSMLVNLTKDVGDIKANLAVNTNETKGMKDHLGTLNGKVVKQEERMQLVEATTQTLMASKKRWDDGWIGLIKQLGLVALGFIIAYVNKHFI